jgi:hypothetical protein
MLTNPNMNRRERRRAEALERLRAARAADIPPARTDGRPQYYDVPMDSEVQCYFCVKTGISAVHRVGRVVQNDPANPPDGQPKGSMFTICTYHLPDDAVIYNPRTNLCRNKTGDHTWEEGPRQEIIDDLRTPYE